MSEFLAVAPTRESYWRSVILFGQNVASYKFASGNPAATTSAPPFDLNRVPLCVWTFAIIPQSRSRFLAPQAVGLIPPGRLG
jgi:hypothetical protein